MHPEKPKRKRRKYDADYKSEVLKMLSNGQSAPQIAQKLGIGENLIYRWKNEQKKDLSKSEEAQKEDFLKIREENEQLRGQLKRVEMERDILKKAVCIFSQSG
jgi:transposase